MSEHLHEGRTIEEWATAAKGFADAADKARDAALTLQRQLTETLEREGEVSSWLEAMRAQRNALAAQISQARALVGSAPELNMSNYDEDQVSILNDTMIALADLLENNDETSLAQRDARMKAQWQAESAVEWSAVAVLKILEEVEHQIGASIPVSIINDALGKLGLREHFGDEHVDKAKAAFKLRRQAEGGEA